MNDKNNIPTAVCTHCGKVLPITDLKLHPDVEASIRSYAKGERAKLVPEGKEYTAMLCPDCYAKLMAEKA